MQWNEDYCTFPIDSRNQINRDVPFIEKMQDSLWHNIFHHFCSNVRWRRQHSWASYLLEQNAEEEVWQYINNEVDDILYFEDRAIFSLSAVDVVIIMQSNDIHTLYISFDIHVNSDLP